MTDKETLIDNLNRFSFDSNEDLLKQFIGSVTLFTHASGGLDSMFSFTSPMTKGQSQEHNTMMELHNEILLRMNEGGTRLTKEEFAKQLFGEGEEND